MTHSLIAIVPAAGVGARASHPESAILPKQYRLLRGEPMLRHTIRALLADPRIEQVRVAVAAEDDWVAGALAGLPRTVWHRCGGPTRAETVAAALADNSIPDTSWILVHDAARPGLPASALIRLIDACLNDSVGGLLALPVADTVKAGDSHVVRTIDRAGLWLAQTPQMFRAGMLRHALAHAAGRAVPITDEASAIEGAGHAPRLVLGSARNFKVTWPEDFELMEKWL
jgi:2-C-methyl-D-erythritol 4-phosphate cytidylyltransferase